MALLSMSFGRPDAALSARRLGLWLTHTLRPSRRAAAANLERFDAGLREAVAAETMASPRLADLAVSCPAALVAIACPGEDAAFVEGARRARALAMEGRPLAQICAAAEVPLWLRRARPETFRARPPRLPDTPNVRRAIANHVPKGAGATTFKNAPWRWLEAVAIAFETADEEVGLWMARRAAASDLVGIFRARVVALWAWRSRHAPQPEAWPRWSPELGWDRASDLAFDWRARLAFDVYGGPGGDARQAWERDGFTFSPLLDFEAIVAEGEAMRHCVADYAYEVATAESTLWSVSKDGARVATAEIGSRDGSAFVGVRQLYGVKNEAAPREAWRAATLFAVDLDARFDTERRVARSREERRRAWEAFWEPYWAAKSGATAWTPLDPPDDGFPAA
jgi:hypothetical protein